MAYSFTPCDNCGREVDRVTSDHTTKPDLHWSHVSDGVVTSLFCNPSNDGSTSAIPHPTIRKGLPRT